MEKRIALEKRGLPPENIEDLNLDNCKSKMIEGLTDEFVNLKNLSLNNVGLTSLKGFPKLPKLSKLELSENRISSGLNVLQDCNNLTYLNLSGNKIKDIETLEPLKQLKHLRVLDLFNNDITSIDNFREKIFTLIPRLKYLDGFDIKEETEYSEETDEGLNDDIDYNEETDGAAKDDREYVEGGDGESINGNEDYSDELEDEEEEEELGLEAVYKDNLEEESEGGDYEGDEFEDEEEDAWDEDDDEEDASGFQPNESDDGAADTSDTVSRGKKRKHESEEEIN